jgi:hypothetical protein
MGKRSGPEMIALLKTPCAIQPCNGNSNGSTDKFRFSSTLKACVSEMQGFDCGNGGCAVTPVLLKISAITDHFISCRR